MTTRRILHVVPALAPRYGGPSTAVIGMCRATAAFGCDTTVVASDADGPDRLPVVAGDDVEFEGVRARFFNRFGPDAFKWTPGASRWLRSHVRDYALVHVHAVLSHPALAAARACRQAGVPYIMRPLGTLDPWSLGRHAARKRVLLALSGRRALEGAAAIHFTSDDEERRARQALPWLPAGVVVPLGVDEEFYTIPSVPEPKSVPYVLTLSRLHPKKGVDLLIRAMHDLASRVPDWRLVVAGDGDPGYVRVLRELAAAGPAASRITFCGWVDGPARASWLRGASLFAAPSEQENFGLAVVQSLAAGVPVLVAQGVGLADDIVRAGAGWKCTREELTNALAQIMREGDPSQCRSAAAQAYAQRFRWSEVGRQLAAAYDAIVGTGSPAVAHPGASPSMQTSASASGGHP